MCLSIPMIGVTVCISRMEPAERSGPRSAINLDRLVEQARYKALLSQLGFGDR
ncbi:MAG: hypothetical protein ACOY93_00940 [Bacillota bacterium]